MCAAAAGAAHPSTCGGAAWRGGARGGEGIFFFESGARAGRSAALSGCADFSRGKRFLVSREAESCEEADNFFSERLESSESGPLLLAAKKKVGDRFLCRGGGE